MKNILSRASWLVIMRKYLLPSLPAFPNGTQWHWISDNSYQRLGPCNGSVQQLVIGQEPIVYVVLLWALGGAFLTPLCQFGLGWPHLGCCFACVVCAHRADKQDAELFTYRYERRRMSVWLDLGRVSALAAHNKNVFFHNWCSTFLKISVPPKKTTLRIMQNIKLYPINTDSALN